MKRTHLILCAMLIVMLLLSGCGEVQPVAESLLPTVDETQANTTALLGGFKSSNDEPTETGSVSPGGLQFGGTISKEYDLNLLMEKINVVFDCGEYRKIVDSDRYYGIDRNLVKQFCAQKPVESDSYCEIVLCEAVSPEAAAQIETQLDRHLDALVNTAASYDKDALAIVEMSEVVTAHNYVYLVISKDYNAICALINSFVQ